MADTFIYYFSLCLFTVGGNRAVHSGDTHKTTGCWKTFPLPGENLMVYYKDIKNEKIMLHFPRHLTKTFKLLQTRKT